MLRRTLQACAAPGNDGALALFRRAGNSAYFEHRQIAAKAGLLLAGPEDIDIHRARAVAVVFRPTGEPVAMLYCAWTWNWSTW